MVAFDRFLARLTSYHVNNWVLKGGLALQLRLGEHSRTTKDMDLLALGHHEDIHLALRNAGNLDLDDWFSFEVAQPDNQRQKDFGGMRFLLNGLLDSRTFEEFHIDVGLGDIIVDVLSMSRLLHPTIQGNPSLSGHLMKNSRQFA